MLLPGRPRPRAKRTSPSQATKMRPCALVPPEHQRGTIRPRTPTPSSLPRCRSPVSERGRSLSAGQRQLICLARARLVDPAILLLDEATSNLDLATEARVQRAMGLVSRDRTTVLIAHRLQTARTADRIVVVDDGRIMETGSHDELLARGGDYAELWNRNLDASISPYAASRPS